MIGWTAYWQLIAKFYVTPPWCHCIKQHADITTVEHVYTLELSLSRGGATGGGGENRRRQFPHPYGFPSFSFSFLLVSLEVSHTLMMIIPLPLWKCCHNVLYLEGKKCRSPPPPPPPPPADRPFQGWHAAYRHFATPNQTPWRRPWYRFVLRMLDRDLQMGLFAMATSFHPTKDDRFLRFLKQSLEKNARGDALFLSRNSKLPLYVYFPKIII